MINRVKGPFFRKYFLVLNKHAKRRLKYSILATVLSLVLVCLSACGFNQTLTKITIPDTPDNFGIAVADEPHAILVSEKIFQDGGNAVDAAVAIYFTLAVTYPSTSSLGGGGLCLVYNGEGAKKQNPEVIEFLPRQVESTLENAGWQGALPGNVRGMYALQARYGRLNWAQLIAPAENLARFGHKVSRALSVDLNVADSVLFEDIHFKNIFTNTNGDPVSEGDTVYQYELGAVLSNLRLRGAGDFYNGLISKHIETGASDIGIVVPRSELRTYKPVWRTAAIFPFGEYTLYTAPEPTAGGITTGAMLFLLRNSDRDIVVPETEIPHLFVEIAKRAFADRSYWMDGENEGAIKTERLLQAMSNYTNISATDIDKLSSTPKRRLENPASTTFITMDKNGLAVSCSITMNNLFGIGKMIPGTGIALAAAPSKFSDATKSFAPIVLEKNNLKKIVFIAGASNGITAASALATVVRDIFIRGMSMSDAFAEPRMHHGGSPNTVFIEQSVPKEIRNELRSRRHYLRKISEIGRVNAIFCPDGMPGNYESCNFSSDQRAYGLGAIIRN